MPPFQKIPVLIDTREPLHTAWEFDCETFTTERVKLDTGDYSIRGYQDCTICVERKTIGDFVGTVIGKWSRFRSELMRMSAFDYAIIVVECNLSDVMEHRYESDALPASVIGRANGIWIDHHVAVNFWGPRPSAIAMTERYLIQLVKKLGGVP